MPRSAKQIAAYLEWRPTTEIDPNYPEAHRLPDLCPVGTRLTHWRTGLAMRYQYAFEGTDGQRYIMGHVDWDGLHGEWACAANALVRVMI